MLIASDVGVETTQNIIERLEARVARDKYLNTEEVNRYLCEEIAALLDAAADGKSTEPFDFSKKPYVMMVVGVNGVGKTTTIGKLASQLKAQGKKVVLGAADTFRAAAVDQLVIWAERAGVDIVKQAMGSDPASVAFDTVKSAVARDADVVIIDTAGRLHNKKNLMEELAKMNRVAEREAGSYRKATMIVLDATTGQNALSQARVFTEATDVAGIILTKVDGTAKGGVVLAIQQEIGVPIVYLGCGERVGDLEIFDADSFVDAMFEE